MTIKKASEFALIEMIKAAFTGFSSRELEGIGDDCAVIQIHNSDSLVVTTDMLVEDIHFLRSGISPYLLGRKSLAVNLSDVAAMGAKPLCSLLAISLPQDVDTAWVEEFIEGYRSLSAEFDTPLVGGDTTASKDKITISVTAIGRTKHINIKRRSGAKVGDLIFVTGKLGASARGLEEILSTKEDLRAWKNFSDVRDSEDVRSQSLYISAHNDPKPYVNEGIWLGGISSVHAMMDVSDGIASDLPHILNTSNVGAEVNLESIPIGCGRAESEDKSELTEAHRRREESSKHEWKGGVQNLSDLKRALCGGEDYVLLLTIDPTEATSIAEQYLDHFGTELYEIGTIIEGKSEIHWLQNGRRIELNWQGFTHF